MGKRQSRGSGENWKIVRKDRLGWILRVFLRDTSAGCFMFMGKRFMRKVKLTSVQGDVRDGALVLLYSFER